MYGVPVTKPKLLGAFIPGADPGYTSKGIVKLGILAKKKNLG